MGLRWIEASTAAVADPDDLLEMLCDVGASELLFPAPWFQSDVAAAQSAGDLVRLAERYRASREATLRRLAEVSDEPVAAVFLAWKLKPTQKRSVGRPDQMTFIDVDPGEEVRAALRLRIEYAIPSRPFSDAGIYLPKDKSVANDGPIYAAATGRACDEECRLELGGAAGTYRVSAVPLWTADEQRGRNGENAVAALVRPVGVDRARRKQAIDGPALFD